MTTIADHVDVRSLIATLTELTDAGPDDTTDPIRLAVALLTETHLAKQAPLTTRTKLEAIIAEMDDARRCWANQIRDALDADAAWQQGFTSGGFALRHEYLTAPPVHIPDGNGGAYKTELVLERTDERTEKLVWWHADDPRPEPHNHPWRFTSTILHGGYTEDRWWSDDGALCTDTLTYRADGTENGNRNDVPSEVFHRVYDVLPGTVTHMMCGPAAPGNAWHYLDLDVVGVDYPDGALIDPLSVYDDFRSLLWDLNPHLRPKEA